MADLNKKQATIKGLLACGYTEDPGRSRKYRAFIGKRHTFLVGPSGALRRTHTTIAASRSFTGNKLHGGFEYAGRFSVRCPSLTKEQYVRVVNAYTSDTLETLDLSKPQEEPCLDK